MDIGSISVAAKDSSGSQTDLARLRDATGKVVGSVFYGTMFKAMRDSEMKGAYGHGGRAEDMFASQLHGILAERMGERTNGSMADALYRHLEKQQRLMVGVNDAASETSI